MPRPSPLPPEAPVAGRVAAVEAVEDPFPSRARCRRRRRRRSRRVSCPAARRREQDPARIAGVATCVVNQVAHDLGDQVRIEFDRALGELSEAPAAAAVLRQLAQEGLPRPVASSVRPPSEPGEREQSSTSRSTRPIRQIVLPRPGAFRSANRRRAQAADSELATDRGERRCAGRCAASETNCRCCAKAGRAGPAQHVVEGHRRAIRSSAAARGQGVPVASGRRRRLSPRCRRIVAAARRSSPPPGSPRGARRRASPRRPGGRSFRRRTGRRRSARSRDAPRPPRWRSRAGCLATLLALDHESTRPPFAPHRDEDEPRRRRRGPLPIESREASAQAERSQARLFLVRSQPVADRPHGLDRRGGIGQRQLAPQVADVDLDHVGAGSCS